MSGIPLIVNIRPLIINRVTGLVPDIRSFSLLPEFLKFVPIKFYKVKCLSKVEFSQIFGGPADQIL